MSAPLVVNTADGAVWLRRAATRGGVALYAPADVCQCPEFVMATEVELAEHGIVGSADVLPMPAGPESRASERGRLRAAFVEALDSAHLTHPCPVLGDQLWTGCVHYDETGRIRVGLCHSERRADAVLAVRDAEVEFLIGEVDRKSARVAELLAERHSTNESLDDAVKELRTPFAERAERESSPAKRQAWLMLARAEESERVSDALTRLIVPSQALREGEPAGDPCHPCGCPKRFDRHAEGCTAQASPQGACQSCGSLPESWCPDCAVCKAGCFDGFVDNSCSHAGAPWGGGR